MSWCRLFQMIGVSQGWLGGRWGRGEVDFVQTLTCLGSPYGPCWPLGPVSCPFLAVNLSGKPDQRGHC